MSVYRAIGLMSGTSLDGIDIALIATDGEAVTRFGPTAVSLYHENERELLRAALTEAATLRERAARPGVLAEAEQMVTTLHAAAVEKFLAANRIDRAAIDVVGFHGQTVLHRPAEHLTVQIGDGPALAAEIGVPVVHDFRAADVAAGGQGAPLVPIFHRALAAMLDRPWPVAVVNIGGVANITFLDEAGDPLAGDTGPGNALIDDFLHARGGPAFDEGGAIAARGKPDEAFVASILAHPFFAAPLTKSLDRNDFALNDLGLPACSLEDGAATLAALTARTIAAIVPHLPARPASWIVAGGGARNRTILRMLEDAVAPARVETADETGWSSEGLEAQAFAYLAVRRLKGLPITFPTTTGVPEAMAGGIVTQP